jgi:long-chain acyl-CoA synthetase
MTVLDLLAKLVKERPDDALSIYQGREVSHREVEDHSNALAQALIAAGVKRGDRVICLFLNCPQSHIAFFAIWKVGGIVVPLNPLYTPFELERSIKTVDAKVAIIHSLWYAAIKGLQKNTNLKTVIPTDIDTYGVKPLKTEGDSAKVEEGDVWWSSLIEKYKGSSRPAVTVKKEDTALILFSGGTTGVPKGAMTTHHAIIITGNQHLTWYKSVVTAGSRVMGVLPLFHAFGVYVAFGFCLLHHTPQVQILNPRDMKNVVETIRDFKIVSIAATPAMFIGILNYPDRKPDDIRSLKLVSSGAAPLLTETKQQLEKLISGVVIEGFGMTETAIAGACTPVKGKWKQGSTGCPLPDVIMRIVDIETGEKELKAGENGELIMQAPNLMTGYWNRPEETAEVLRNGWLYTGDVGYLDDDGYLFLTSRKKELIKVGGFQVWPREVEEVIAMHPAVAEVAVAAVPDPKQGEAVKAWVVLKEGKEVTAEELHKFTREKLTGYKVPKHIEFRKDLPKTLVGKVLRRVLQEEEQNKTSGAK